MLNPKAKVGLLVSVLGSTVAAQAAAAEPLKLTTTSKVTQASVLSLSSIAARLAKLKYVLSGPVSN